jgi:UDP:flavonoid glycosyltransferase YjiC (YdhE family)
VDVSRILFFTWSGGGNQPPAIGLAQQLGRRGHEIIVAGYADQAARFSELGLEFALLPRSSTPREPFDPTRLMELVVAGVWACPDHLADTADVIDRYRPDLVVVDCLMGAVLAAMEVRQVRTVALVHSTPGALAPPGGPIDGFVVGELNRVRSAAGIEPVDGFWDAWERHTVVCASIPELDPLGRDAVDRFGWIGPVFEDLSATTWAPDADDAPLVLVSFSSGGAWDQTSRIQNTIDGLAETGTRTIVTTGAVDPSCLRVPSTSITVERYVPHAAILPYAAAVVTHAGHGTLTAAFAHGLPVVAIPNLAADQPALAARAAHLGAGIQLHEDDAAPSDIGRAVRTVLEEPSYARSARALADRIKTYREPWRSIEAELGAGTPRTRITATASNQTHLNS